MHALYCYILLVEHATDHAHSKVIDSQCTHTHTQCCLGRVNTAIPVHACSVLCSQHGRCRVKLFLLDLIIRFLLKIFWVFDIVFYARA